MAPDFSQSIAESASLTEIIEILTFRAGFNTAVVVAGTSLLGLAAGVVGVFALLRKRALVADAVSHATLPGIGIAFLILVASGRDGHNLPGLLLGAASTAVLGSWAIGLLVRHTRLREDAAIGIVLSVFFGAGIAILSYIQQAAPTGSAGLHSFIFGQAATMRQGDVVLMASIAVIAVLVTVAIRKELALVCFNDSFARVDGWSVGTLDAVIIGLVVLVTVAGLQAVGLLMVVAMLIIPPAAARYWTERLGLLVLLAGLIGAASGYVGSTISATFPRKPAGAVIVLTAGAVFACSMMLAPSRGVLGYSVRRIRLQIRFAADHLLEAAHEAGKNGLTRADIIDFAHSRGWVRGWAGITTVLLRARGLVTSDGEGGVALTDAGRVRGARVHRNHTLWTQYLVSFADIAPSHVDWSVDQVEHALSPDLVALLERQLSLAAAPTLEAASRDTGTQGGGAA